MVLSFDGVTKKYKGKNSKCALNNFTATFSNGVYGLLGPNGAGKTTLINIMTGILKATSGNVYCDGVLTQKMGLDFISKIGYLPQYPTFYKDFRAREFLHYICAIKDIPKADTVKRTEELLDMVNLSDEAEKKVGAYSGGMRQRLGIAQAMLNNPSLLILDEPTAGLDPKERIRFRNIISKLSTNRIVILATHIVSDVEYIANEVILLKEGVMIAKETPIELIKRVGSKVYGLSATDENITDFMEKYNISNIQHNKDSYNLRIVSDTAPSEDAVLMPPSLEDVFLYYFKEEHS